MFFSGHKLKSIQCTETKKKIKETLKKSPPKTKIIWSNTATERIVKIEEMSGTYKSVFKLILEANSYQMQI